MTDSTPPQARVQQEIEDRVDAITRRCGAIYGADAIREVVTELAESDARVCELDAVAEKHGVPRFRNKPLALGFDMLLTSMKETRDALKARAEASDARVSSLHKERDEWMRESQAAFRRGVEDERERAAAEVSRLREERDEARAAEHKWLIEYGMLAKSKAAAERVFEEDAGGRGTLTRPVSTSRTFHSSSARAHRSSCRVQTSSNPTAEPQTRHRIGRIPRWTWTLQWRHW